MKTIKKQFNIDSFMEFIDHIDSKEIGIIWGVDNDRIPLYVEWLEYFLEDKSVYEIAIKSWSMYLQCKSMLFRFEPSDLVKLHDGLSKKKEYKIDRNYITNFVLMY